MTCTEEEAAARTGVQAARLRVWTAEGWVRPARGPEGPVFDALDLARIALVARLRDELELGDEALPVVLSLLDQMHGMRAEMRRLCAALDALPPELRARIAQATAEG